MDAPQKSAFTRNIRWVSAFCQAVLPGLVIAQILVVWLTTCGASVPASVAATLALIISAAGLSKLRLPNSLTTTIIHAIALSALSLCAAPLVEWTLSVSALAVSGEAFFVQLLTFLPAALVSSVIIAAALCWLPADWKSGSTASWTVHTGLAAGLLLPMLNSYWSLPLGLFTTVVVALSLLFRWLSHAHIDSPQQTSTTPVQNTAHTVVLSSSIGSGLLIFCAWQLVTLMMPGNLDLLLTSLAMCLLLLATTRLPLIKAAFSAKATAAVCLLALAGVPLVFSRFMDINLQLTAFTASATQLAGRAIQLAVLWFAIVTLWKRLASADSSGRQYPTASAYIYLMPGIAAGQLLMLTGLSVTVLYAIGLTLCLIPLIYTQLSGVTTPESVRQKWTRMAIPALGGLCIAAGVFTGLDTTTPARLLFNARSFHALRAGVEQDLIPQSDPARLMETHNSADGVLTVWRTARNLIEVRQDGIPVGLVSEDTLISPQPIAEVATGILGLTTHRKPGTVMILGDDSGACLRACCGFPVQSIEAVRPSPEMNAFASRYTWSGMRMSPVQDNRVKMTQQNASLAIRNSPAGQTDVLIVSSNTPLTLDAQATLTAEFYSHASRVLTQDGVLCQRFQQYDLGAEPLLRLLSTVSASFAQTTMVQVVPGEVAVLATNSELDLLDKDFMDRLQRSHVCMELGRSGWDWAQLAGLPVIDVQDPVGIFKHQEPRSAASSANGYFALSLPLDAQRWGDKSQEIRTAFAPHQMRIAEATPIGRAHEEFRRRISAVAQQMEILSHFPDQPWPYRSSLKTEMQRNPRPPIEYVENNQVRRRAHPLDEYRKQYFVALGEALRQTANGQLSTESLQDLQQFSYQYEPLLSYFAHHELVRIHELAGHPSVKDEWQHRLHTVFYHEPSDYSVRHVASAIDYLLDHEEVANSDADRFDLLNAMLQELVTRWEARRSYEPTSASAVQNDVDQCVQVANRALDRMLELHTTLGLNRDDLLSRRRYLNTVLVGPLREYRDAIVAHRVQGMSGTPQEAETEEVDKPLLLDADDLLTN
jgi:hypothetical protein